MTDLCDQNSSKTMDFLFLVVVFTTLVICLFFKLSTCAIKLEISCYLMVSSFIQRATSCCFTSWFVWFFSHQLHENRSSTKADEREGAIWRTRKAFRSIHKCKACYRLKDLHMVNHGIHEQWLHNPLHHSHSIQFKHGNHSCTEIASSGNHLAGWCKIMHSPVYKCKISFCLLAQALKSDSSLLTIHRMIACKLLKASVY